MTLTQEEKKEIYDICSPYTMLSKERIFANIESVENIVNNNILGDIVEIGVWKGGSTLSMILTLEKLNATRNIVLYDTFFGMTDPTNLDYQIADCRVAESLMSDDLIKAHCPLFQVIQTLNNHTTKKHNISYIQGDICKTNIFPKNISILRLDTDWYESTKFELENFYDLVSNFGIIIVDDYGHWNGSKLAVDEFIHERNIKSKIFFIDYTGIYFIKNHE
jgi:O-methyltransferase